MVRKEAKRLKRRNSGSAMMVCYRILHKSGCSSFNIKDIGSKKHFRFLLQKFPVIAQKICNENENGIVHQRLV